MNMQPRFDLQSTASADVLRVARRWVTPTATVIAGVAIASDPAGPASLLALAAAVATFAAWAALGRGLGAVVTVAVVSAVTGAQLSGRLEPAMFLVTLWVVIAAASEDSWLRVIVIAAFACTSPAVLSAVQPANVHLAWVIWILGILFSVAVGRGVYRQQQLSEQLAEAHARLARQAQIDQRHRIARDVHDLVGNGLAAVLLHVTGARHVLRDDLDAAEDALANAEEAGRRSLRELRETMVLLRAEDGERGLGAPVRIADVEALAATARASGLEVVYRATGNLDSVSPSAGAAMFRIAQEALTNATRHAPEAATEVAIEVASDQVVLSVESIGPVRAAETAGPNRFGLVGMRERAAAIGAEFDAGPSDRGWLVRCRVVGGTT
jgi:signal transduction histidine kinase